MRNSLPIVAVLWAGLILTSSWNDVLAQDVHVRVSPELKTSTHKF
jgi:hypothetical protein